MGAVFRTVWMLGGLALSALPGRAVAAPLDEAGLRACLEANLPRRTLSQDILLLQTDPQGMRRELVGSWFWRHESGDRSGMLRLRAPADLAGAAYLFLSRQGKEDMYVYLPAVRKMRHVTGATIAQTLFGSGLSAFDLKFLFGGIRGGTLQRIDSVLHQGRPAERWRYLPPQDPDILYDRLELTIDRGWCLPVHARLFGGVPWKELTIAPADVFRIGSRWSFRRAVLKDLREGTLTDIQLRNETADQPLPPALFQPNRFYRGK